MLEISEQEDVEYLQSLPKLSRLIYGLGLFREPWEEDSLEEAHVALHSLRSLRVLETGLDTGSQPAAVHHLCRLTQLHALHLHVLDDATLDDDIDLSTLPLQRLSFEGRIDGAFVVLTAPSVTYLSLSWEAPAALGPTLLPDLTTCTGLQQLQLGLARLVTVELTSERLPPQTVQLRISREDSSRLTVQPGARVRMRYVRPTSLGARGR